MTMLLKSIAFVLLIPLASTYALPSNQEPLSSSNQELQDSSYRIPTVHESAVQARRIFHLESVGTVSTIFPSNPSVDSTNAEYAHLHVAPPDVAHTAIGLPEYFADCEFSTGNPTLLRLPIGTSFRNVAAGSNFTLSVMWNPPAWQGTPYSVASQPRFALIGNLEDMTEEEVKKGEIPKCFGRYHNDAKLWFPGNKIHTSRWARMIVKEIYWIGSFGDRAYIGWIPVEEWRSVTMKEIESIRLPGE